MRREWQRDMLGMKLPKFITIQGNPVHPYIGAYIAVAVNDAKATVDSIYRGADAEPILNRHGKHSQAQIFWTAEHGNRAQREAMGLNPNGGGANPPGQSTHELKSDAVAYPGIPKTHDLEWWMQGFDVNDADVLHVISAARKHGWKLFRPYRTQSEFHHLNFAARPARPRPGTRMWARIWRIRLTYPTR